MAKKILWSGSTTLPAPTSLSVNDEIIWTSDTGRTLAGLMVGAVVAQKKNLSIKWEFLTESQVKQSRTHWFRVSSHSRFVTMELISRYKAIEER